ncbi:PTS sugar transporter subunit IIC [Aerococcus urinae]|uniref:PTS mannose/fructose/sorbose/N-acetylgalactosamine transporter subunit IIC n=1 Tax=Aerococcus urinae TaxID=1376 RepID=UPI00254E9C8A|nr:PTS sugar transporter subunit IIC [Aerococcus urinae]MDK6371108.1 PTS sugar transporter subunit IIC [Aerococcus urinae]
MSILWQSILVAIFVSIAFIDSHTFQTHIFRPIVVGPIVGLIMGDVGTGMQVGVAVELMFLAVIFVGTAAPPDPTISTAIATAVAIYGGGSTELAIATALPVSFIGQMATTFQNSIINVWFMHRAEVAANDLDTKGIVRNNTIYPMILNFVLFGIPTFLAVYYGADFVQLIINSIPEKIITGLAVGGNMIGAVGFALLLTTIKQKNMWPFFLLGFFVAAYMEVNMIGVSMLAVICCALYYYFVIKKETY